MKIYSFFPLILMCSSVFSVQAQIQESNGPAKFSLSEAKSYALDNSPILLNSARDVEIAKKQIWESTATGLPQVSINSSYAYTPKLAGLSDQLGAFIPNFNPNDLKTSFMATGQVSQLIFNGQYIVGLQAAKVYANLSKLAENKSKIGVEENITNTYFTVLIAKQSKIILDSSLASIQKTKFQSEQMFKNGFIESSDVDQITILESNIKSSLSVTERQIDIMERMLKYQMGYPIDKQIELTDQIDPLMVQMNIDVATVDSFRLEKNVDYQMLDTQEKLQKLNMRLSMSKFLPTVSGYYTYYKSLDHNFFNDQSPNTFGLSLSFPLFSSGQRLSEVAHNRLEYMKAQTDKANAAEGLRLQYESAYSAFLSARDVFNIQLQNRDLAYKIYQKSMTKFREGVGSSLDLNQTQSQYFTAETNYFSAMMSLVSAKSTLESLLANSSN